MYGGVDAGFNVRCNPPQAVHVVVHDLQHHVLYLVTVCVQVAVGQVLRIVDVEQIAVVDIRKQRVLAYVDLQGGGIIAFLVRGEVICGYIIVIFRIVLEKERAQNVIVASHVFLFSQQGFGTVQTVGGSVLFFGPIQVQALRQYGISLAGFIAPR